MREVKRSNSGFTRSRESYNSPKSHSSKSRLHEFNRKEGIAIGLIIIIAFGLPFGVWIFGYSPYFHNVVCKSTQREISLKLPCGDPVQPLWFDHFSTADLQPYNTFGTVSFCIQNCDGLTNLRGIHLVSNSTTPAIALTKNPVSDLSSISAKELAVTMEWIVENFPNGATSGFFLTRNSTISNFNSYNPVNDVSVAWYTLVRNSNGNLQTFEYLQQDPNLPVIKGAETGCTADIYFCIGTQSCTFGNQLTLKDFEILNFTSGGTANSNGISSFQSQTINGSCSATQVTSNTSVPWFKFQGEKYYLGIWVSPNSATVDWVTDDNTATLCAESGFIWCQETPATSNPSPPSSTYDTGGFFGSLLRGLTTLFAPAIQVLIGFFNYLTSILNPVISVMILTFGIVFTAIFNAIGSVFGDPTLGNQILNFVSNLSSYLANNFSNEIAFLASGLSILSNSLSIVTAFFLGSNPFVTLWVGILSFLAGSVGLLATFLQLINVVVFGFNLIGIFALALLFFGSLMDWEESDNPLAGLTCILLFGFLFYVLAFGGNSISPIASNASIQANYQTAFNNVKWFFQISPLLFVFMFVKWIGERDEIRRIHGGSHFMPNFQNLLNFYILVLSDVFRLGYFFFHSAFTIVTMLITALKGRWSPVEVAGTG